MPHQAWCVAFPPIHHHRQTRPTPSTRPLYPRLREVRRIIPSRQATGSSPQGQRRCVQNCPVGDLAMRGCQTGGAKPSNHEAAIATRHARFCRPRKHKTRTAKGSLVPQNKGGQSITHTLFSNRALAGLPSSFRLEFRSRTLRIV